MNWNLPENPFVGLRPFEAEESLLFFGRDEQTRELLQHLHTTRFLAVVGGSGCGKSSLIRAGLIPKLQGGFLVEEHDEWLIAKMKPGDAPILYLAEALLNATGNGEESPVAAEFAEAISEQGVQVILAQLDRSVQENDANLLLLVDQFEEIFRYGLYSDTSENRDDAADFVSLMLALAEQREVPIYVTMTMRSDFLGDCDAFIGLPEAMNKSQYLVPRLTRQQRREAIEGPIRLYQKSISPPLTDRLLNETGENRDDLPVLQHTLMRCWSKADERGDTTIDNQHYKAIGTVHEALSQHAEEALKEMDENTLRLTKRIFQTLTETDAGNRRIRRPAKLSEIEAITGTSRDEIWDIIQKFRSDGRSFLVVSSENTEDNPSIDISHESLIRQWGELKNWVDEEAQSARTYLYLADTAVLHRKGQAGYHRDPYLQIVLNWREKNQPNEAWARRYHPESAEPMRFLEASKEAREVERAKQAKEAERQREFERTKAIAEEREKRLTEQGIAKMRLRMLLSGLMVVTLFAVGAAIFALNQSKIAQQQTRIAFSRELAVAANENLIKNPELSVLLALQAVKETYDAGKNITDEAEIALRRVVQAPLVRLTLKGHSSNVYGVAFSPDGKYIATASRDGTARLYTFDIEELIKIAQKRVNRELTPEERRRYLHEE